MCRAGSASRGHLAINVTATPPDVPRWLASRISLLLACGLCPPSRTLFQLATEMGKGGPSVQLALRRRQARAQPNSVFGSYREASHRGTSGGTAVTRYGGFPLTFAGLGWLVNSVAARFHRGKFNLSTRWYSERLILLCRFASLRILELFHNFHLSLSSFGILEPCI